MTRATDIRQAVERLANTPLQVSLAEWGDVASRLLAAAADELERLKAENERLKADAARRYRCDRDSLARHLATLDGIALGEIRSTNVDPSIAHNWRKYGGKADDLLALLREEIDAAMAKERAE